MMRSPNCAPLQERNKGVVEVLVYLARIYVKLQQYPEAKSAFRQIDAVDPDNLSALRIKGRNVRPDGRQRAG